MKHSPGPWQAARQDDDDGSIWYDIWCPKEGQSIAHVYEDTRNRRQRGKVRADAQLIAAAPSLLEACKALTAIKHKIYEWRIYELPPDLQEAINQIENAIRLAEEE